MKKKIKSWESKKAFKDEVYLCAHKLEVSVKHIVLRTMTTKWASCSTSGYFTFNGELLGMDRKLGKYVILHELLHFYAPNHGRLWKSLMMVYMPDHELIARRLKDLSLKNTAR